MYLSRHKAASKKDIQSCAHGARKLQTEILKISSVKESILSCLTVLAMGTICANSLHAEVQVHAYFELGSQGTQLMHAAGPMELANQVDGSDLKVKRFGKPAFYSEHPTYFALKGPGCLAFDGKHDQYHVQQALIPDSRRFVIEAWTQAEQTQHHGLHVVVAHGNGGRGFLIAQQDDQWVVFVGGVGAVPFGKVVADQWVHLAAVYDHGSLTLYRNGANVMRRPVGWHGLIDNFSIGGIGGRGNEGFAGRICAVRLSTFGSGQFDPATDLLLDQNKIAEQQGRTPTSASEANQRHSRYARHRTR